MWINENNCPLYVMILFYVFLVIILLLFSAIVFRQFFFNRNIPALNSVNLVCAVDIVTVMFFFWLYLSSRRESSYIKS